MFSVVTKYHKGRHSLFLYNSEIFYARPITAMLILQLNVVVMNALIGIYVIFILKGLVLSTLVLKI